MKLSVLKDSNFTQYLISAVSSPNSQTLQYTEKAIRCEAAAAKRQDEAASDRTHESPSFSCLVLVMNMLRMFHPDSVNSAN